MRPTVAHVQNTRHNPLPKTMPTDGQGAVCAQRVRCGKPACRCMHGGDGHLTHYLFWRENGRLRKRYIPRRDLDRVQEACRTYRQRRAYQRGLASKAVQAWRHLETWLREVECGNN